MSVAGLVLFHRRVDIAGKRVYIFSVSGRAEKGEFLKWQRAHRKPAGGRGSAYETKLAYENYARTPLRVAQMLMYSSLPDYTVGLCFFLLFFDSLVVLVVRVFVWICFYPLRSRGKFSMAVLFGSRCCGSTVEGSRCCKYNVFFLRSSGLFVLNLNYKIHFNIQRARKFNGARNLGNIFIELLNIHIKIIYYSNNTFKIWLFYCIISNYKISARP